MIFATLILIVVGFINVLNNLLPTGSLPVGITNALALVVNYFNAFNSILPLDTLLQAVGVMIAYEAAVLIWHFFHMGYGMIRGNK